MEENELMKLSEFLTKGFGEKRHTDYIFDKVEDQSVFQKLGQKIAVDALGAKIPVTTGTIDAFWQANEGDIKESSRADFEMKDVATVTLAVVTPISNQLLQSNPDGVIDQVKKQVAGAFAKKFDETVISGTLFGDNLNSSQTVELGSGATLFSDLSTAIGLIAESRKYSATGFVFDAIAESAILSTVDAVNRPLFIQAPYTDTAVPFSQGKLLGRPTYFKRGLTTDNTLGFVGDWSQLAWGQAGAIEVKLSDVASITIGNQLQSGFERNFSALRAETKYSICLNDLNAFAKLVQDVSPEEGA